MKLRMILGALMAVALIAPQAAEAKSKKKSGGSSSSSSMGAGAEQIVSLNVALVLNAPSGFSAYLPMSVGYEKALSSMNSVVGELSYSSLGGNSAYSAAILGLDGGYRWWLGAGSGNLQGFYAGPKAYLQMLSWSYTYSETYIDPSFNIATRKVTISDSKVYFGIGGEGGYQWVFANHWTASAGGEAVLPIGLPAGFSIPLTLMAKGSVGYSF